MLNGVEYGPYNFPTAGNPSDFPIFEHYNDNYLGYLDLIFMRKLASPEPTTSIGNEEIYQTNYTTTLLLRNPSQAILKNLQVVIKTEDGKNHLYEFKNQKINPGEIKVLEIKNIPGKPVKAQVTAGNCGISAEKEIE